MTLTSHTGPRMPTFDRWGNELRPDAPPKRQSWASRMQRPKVRRAVLLLAVLAIAGAAVAVAVSGNRSHPHRRATQIVVGHVTPSPRTVAGAINLRASDLSGYRVGTSAGLHFTGDPAALLRQCLGSGGAAAQSISSPALVTGSGLTTVMIGSVVTFPSPAQLASDSASFKGRNYPQCIANAMANLAVTTNGVRIRGSDPDPARLAPVVAAGGGIVPLRATRSSAIRPAGTSSFTVFLDSYVLAVGGREVALFALSAVHPVSAASERQLVSLLVSRARTEAR